MSLNFKSRFAWGLCTLVAGALLLRPSAAADEIAKKVENENGLPLTKVVMFNSGVGYFEHRGDVEGDAFQYLVGAETLSHITDTNERH